MSTHTVNRTSGAVETRKPHRLITFLDAHSPTLFLGGYLLGLAALGFGMALTGHLHG